MRVPQFQPSFRSVHNSGGSLSNPQNAVDHPSFGVITTAKSYPNRKNGYSSRPLQRSFLIPATSIHDVGLHLYVELMKFDHKIRRPMGAFLILSLFSMRATWMRARFKSRIIAWRIPCSAQAVPLLHIRYKMYCGVVGMSESLMLCKQMGPVRIRDPKLTRFT